MKKGLKTYTPKEIEEIFDFGSVEEKATLFLRDRMGYFRQGLDFILDFGDPENLTDSIRPHEQTKWNEYISMGLRVENAFRDLNRFLIGAVHSRDILSQTLTLLTDFEEMEDILNETLLLSTLNNPIDQRTKDDIETFHHLIYGTAQYTLSNRVFTYLRPTITQVADIDLNLRETTNEEGDKFQTLRQRVEYEWRNCETWMRKFLFLVEAMRRRFQLMEIVLPEYEYLINQYSTTLETPLAGSLRFQGVQDERLFFLGDYDKNRSIDSPYPAMREIIEDYSIRLSDIDIDKIENKEETINKYFNSI